MLEASGFQVGDEIPEGGGLIEVADGRHDVNGMEWEFQVKSEPQTFEMDLMFKKVKIGLRKLLLYSNVEKR